MAYEQKDNSGSLFENDRKVSENQPDRKGKVMIGGRMYWVSAWEKQGQNGPWLSLAFTEMEDHRGGGGQRPQQQRGNGSGGNFNRGRQSYDEQNGRSVSRPAPTRTRDRDADFDRQTSDVPY